MADRTPLPTPEAGATYVFHAHANREVWTWAAAVSIAAELRRELIVQPRARLLLSGGETPGPVYRALSQAPLDWERVDVGLVDERWLLPDDPDSNAYLVHREFLRDHAAVAHFEPMTQAGRNLEGAVATANAHARREATVAVFGMGDDGHTASLFPGMNDAERVLASPRDYVAVDAQGCPGARQWTRRISLTPRGIARIAHRLLLIQGERKRAVFEQAVAAGDRQRWPVLVTLDSSYGTPLDVHWCA
ncbi:6-phosphogluconolactonase [Lysobacter auxotrophicus]|uniref:6-phosphogluconolactonase n=1 Tax=Lysobacter auxotrophicus TaxID=2992573 RepID=A0ABM8DCE3_9GAMM|nr:6-phosphogluconolactonase [Lysobacter auxotrophicus]BDU16253.1 6-phosphogluconolactonase [Lysobacter auxotrophicus]